MALSLEHPDIHWYFPLTRPKGASGDKLAGALEQARIDRLAELRSNPLYPSQGDELRGIYLSTVKGIRKRAHVRPTMSRVQIFIVGDAEFLVPQEASQEAANALLKLLEEPPADTHFMLTSSEPGRLLPTIRSRTVPLHLAALTRGEVEGFLAEHAGAEPATVAWATGLAQGSIGRAMGFLPDGEDHGPLEVHRRKSFRLIQAALAKDLATGFAASLGYPPSGARSLVELFSAMEEWLRDLAAVASGAEDQVTNHDALEALRKLVREGGLQAGEVAAAMPALEEARELSRGNVNPQLVVSGTLRKIRRALRPAVRQGAGTR
jgi:DNA polymerase-3 subunit delta'